MSILDRTALALNTATPILLLLAFFTESEGVALATIIVGFLALMLSSASILRLSARAEGTSSPELKQAEALADEMDARTLLDIDARLESLERREREMDEADRIRQMVARGEQSAPAVSEPSRLGTEADRVRG
ncbi:MAG: hypothetical protein AAF791_04350 [Bacteroidota bacterium]